MGEPCRADGERFDSVVMSDDDDKDTGIKTKTGPSEGRKISRKIQRLPVKDYSKASAKRVETDVVLVTNRVDESRLMKTFKNE